MRNAGLLNAFGSRLTQFKVIGIRLLRLLLDVILHGGDHGGMLLGTFWIADCRHAVLALFTDGDDVGS